ncbi:hypothetical protein [Streptomyces sp. NPDC086010]|uniref:hypothetical protein n=1 Tax=Streptomyces sp. NPDC086010 TaxID=3365745 RepID=UPI0037CEE988
MKDMAASSMSSVCFQVPGEIARSVKRLPDEVQRLAALAQYFEQSVRPGEAWTSENGQVVRSSSPNSQPDAASAELGARTSDSPHTTPDRETPAGSGSVPTSAGATPEVATGVHHLVGEAELREVAGGGSFPDETALGLNPPVPGSDAPATAHNLLKALRVPAAGWSAQLDRDPRGRALAPYRPRHPGQPATRIDVWAWHWSAQQGYLAALDREMSLRDGANRTERTAGLWSRARAAVEDRAAELFAADRLVREMGHDPGELSTRLTRLAATEAEWRASADPAREPGHDVDEPGRRFDHPSVGETSRPPTDTRPALDHRPDGAAQGPFPVVHTALTQDGRAQEFDRELPRKRSGRLLPADPVDARSQTALASYDSPASPDGVRTSDPDVRALDRPQGSAAPPRPVEPAALRTLLAGLNNFGAYRVDADPSWTQWKESQPTESGVNPFGKSSGGLQKFFTRKPDAPVIDNHNVGLPTQPAALDLPKGFRVSQLSDRDVAKILTRSVTIQDRRIIGMSFHHDEDWSRRENIWSSYDLGQQAYASYPYMELMASRETLPWVGHETFYITVHGKYDVVKLYQRSGNSIKEKIVDSSGLARIVEVNPDFQRMRRENPDLQVVLVICESGLTRERSMAQQLANLLGVTVHAPNGKVTLMSSQTLGSTALTVYSQGEEAGTFLTFFPGNHGIHQDARPGTRDTTAGRSANSGSRPVNQASRLRGGAPDLVSEWHRASSTGAFIRSAKLKRIDTAVSELSEDRGNPSRLHAVLSAVTDWRKEKNPTSDRWEAVQRLELQIRTELDTPDEADRLTRGPARSQRPPERRAEEPDLALPGHRVAAARNPVTGSGSADALMRRVLQDRLSELAPGSADHVRVQEVLSTYSSSHVRPVAEAPRSEAPGRWQAGGGTRPTAPEERSPGSDEEVSLVVAPPEPAGEGVFGPHGPVRSPEPPGMSGAPSVAVRPPDPEDGTLGFAELAGTRPDPGVLHAGAAVRMSPSLRAGVGYEIELPGVNVARPTRGEVLLRGEGWRLETDRSGDLSNLEFVFSPMTDLRDILSAGENVVEVVARMRTLALSGPSRTFAISDVAAGFPSDLTVVRDETVTVHDPQFKGRLQVTYGIGLADVAAAVDDLLSTAQASVIHAKAAKVEDLYLREHSRALSPEARGFVELVVMYLERARAQFTLGGTVHSLFRMMSRSDFLSIYEKLLSPTDRRQVGDLILPGHGRALPRFMEALDINASDLVFKVPYSNPEYVKFDGPTVIDWLSSIADGRADGPLRKDLLSPPPGIRTHTGDLDVDYGMGAMGVDEGNKLALFEIRGAPYRAEYIPLNRRFLHSLAGEYERATRYNPSIPPASFTHLPEMDLTDRVGNALSRLRTIHQAVIKRLGEILTATQKKVLLKSLTGIGGVLKDAEHGLRSSRKFEALRESASQTVAHIDRLNTDPALLSREGRPFWVAGLGHLLDSLDRSLWAAGNEVGTSLSVSSAREPAKRPPGREGTTTHAAPAGPTAPSTHPPVRVPAQDVARALAAFAEDVRPALRVWDRPVADEVAGLENDVLRTWGSRSVVFGAHPVSPATVINVGGTLRWFAHGSLEPVPAPASADGPVVSLDLDDNGQLTGLRARSTADSGARTGFCAVNVGADLSQVLGWRAPDAPPAGPNGRGLPDDSQEAHVREDGPRAFLDAPRSSAGD